MLLHIYHVRSHTLALLAISDHVLHSKLHETTRIVESNSKLKVAILYLQSFFYLQLEGAPLIQPQKTNFRPPNSK